MPVFIATALLSYALTSVGVSMIVASIVSFAVGGLLRSAMGGGQKDRPSAPQASTIQASGRNVTVRQPIAPWQIIYGRARVGGILTFVEESPDKQFLHLVITLAGHPVEEIGDIYLDDELVPLDGVIGGPWYVSGGGGSATGKYAGHVYVQKSLGDEAESGSPASDGQPFHYLVGASSGKWTNAHRQSGRAKLYVRLLANPDIFPTGVPNITAVVKGRKVFDPRVSPTADRWTANVSLCVNDFITHANFGLAATYATEMDAATLVASANECDESVTLAGSPPTAEARYELNGAFLVDETPKSILERMLAGMAGWAVNVGGKWFIYAGAYEAPTITLDEGDLSGPIRVQPQLSRSSNANGVKGTFVDPNQSWQPVDFPPILGTAYLAEDNSERVWRDIDQTGFCTSGSMAQRIAKIELLRTRQGLSVSATFKLSAYRAVTGRTVALTIAKYGWTDKPFDVVGCGFAMDSEGALGIRLELRETAAAVYEWSTSDEQAIDIAPNTNFPDPFDVGAPSGLAFEQNTSVWDSAALSWTASADSFLTGYQLEYATSQTGSPQQGAWTILPITRDPSFMVTRLTPREYNFRVKAINSFGVSSAYATLTATVEGPMIRLFGSESGKGALQNLSEVSLSAKGWGGAWAPNVNLLFVGVDNDSQLHKLDVINPINDRLVTSISLSTSIVFGPHPDVVYCPANGKLYAILSTSLYEINPYTMAVERVIEGVGGTLESALCYCPTNSRIYITDSLSGTMEVVDPLGSPQVATMSTGVGTATYDITFCPRNGKLYAGATGGGNDVRVINPLTNTVHASINCDMSSGFSAAASGGIVYCPDNNRIYVVGINSSLAGTVAVVNVDTNAAVAHIAGGSPDIFSGDLRGIEYSRESGLLYLADYGNGKVHTIDPATNTVVASTDFNSQPFRLTWVPSVSKIYAASYGSQMLTASGV